MKIAGTRCGYVAIVGRPNVGKSTLLNTLVNQKISITSKRPRTTCHRIEGILNLDKHQIIFVDTPGCYINSSSSQQRQHNRETLAALYDVDAVLWVVNYPKWEAIDNWLAKELVLIDVPVLLVINKIDLLKDKSQMLPYIQECSKHYTFAEIIPVSAYQNLQLDVLQQTILDYIPEGMPLFPENEVSTQSLRFLISEIIREKIIRHVGEELPYALTVHLDSLEQKKRILHIHGTLWVQRASQKAIVIGHKGERLKRVGILARQDIEKLMDQQVMLRLWTRVRDND